MEEWGPACYSACQAPPPPPPPPPGAVHSDLITRTVVGSTLRCQWKLHACDPGGPPEEGWTSVHMLLHCCTSRQSHPGPGNSGQGTNAVNRNRSGCFGGLLHVQQMCKWFQKVMHTHVCLHRSSNICTGACACTGAQTSSYSRCLGTSTECDQTGPVL